MYNLWNCEDQSRGGERKMDWDPPPTPQSFDLFYLILKCYDWLKTNKYLLLKVLHCSGLAASLCSINIVCVITKL
jgi:hypothetical protein